MTLPAQFATATVKAGGKVTWVNCEAAGTDSHTSTSDAGIWSSPLLAPGATFTQQLNTAGSFPYRCQPHTGIQATIGRVAYRHKLQAVNR